MANVIDIPEHVIYSDADCPLQFTVRENGEPKDLTGLSFLFEVRDEFSDVAALISLTVGSGITITGTDNNVLLITISDTDLDPDDIPPGQYEYMLRRDDAGYRRPLAVGKFIVTGAAARD